MITKPTTLILGAGASFESGYPLGKKLYQKACNDLVNGTGTLTNNLEPLFGSKPLEHLGNALEQSKTNSIDLFININPDYEQIGKSVIAHLLLETEITHYANQKSTQEIWYNYLWERLISQKPEQFTNNQLRIVTFNYDRSFEHYLYQRLYNLYLKMPKIDIVKAALSIPVIHVYGQLGFLDWHPGNRNKIEYGMPGMDHVGSTHVEIAAEEIQLIYANRSDAAPFKEAYEALEWAESCYFLGFGFDEINLNNLQVENVSGGKSKFRGVGIERTATEIKQINATHQLSISVASRSNIVEYLRNEVTLV